MYFNTVNYTVTFQATYFIDSMTDTYIILL